MVVVMNNKGFSLVEISIGLVVVGLLVSGVFAGQALIKSARLKSVISDLQNYTTAVNAFYDQFGYWPGDFPNAHAIWACGNGVAPTGCNGNGNGVIESASPNAGTEQGRTWQHLALANMVPGNFDGTTKPKSKYSGGFYSMSSETIFGYTGIAIAFGANNTTSLSATNGLLSVLDAQNIDRKIDDGVANTGFLMAASGDNKGANDCSAAPTTAGGVDYKLDSTVNDACRITYFIFK
jgi:prepilin-type N-terminal cleavage/methylation domain-containing protein